MTPKKFSDLPGLNKFNFKHKMDKLTKYGVISLSTIIFGILFGWIIFPKILNFMLRKEMSLAKGTDIRDMWTKVPFALDFRIYIFNITNPDEIMKGAKPRVQEVGPYYYEEWKEKVNLVDLDDEDAIVYNRKDTFLFKHEKSGMGLTGNEFVIIPDPILVAVVVYAHLEKPTMLNLVSKAINFIFDQPKTIFVKVKVSDLLFDGLMINCQQTEFSAKGVCSALKKSKALEVAADNQLKFSLFGKKNGTVEKETFKVLRGIKNIMDVGRVVEFDGKTSMNVWSGPECNNYLGTDGTIFPPFLTEKDDIESFSPELCRSLSAWYERKTSYAGLGTNRYIADLGDLSSDPKLHCFCNTPDTCPKKGLMDITRCVDGPLVASMPHFLYTDESVQQSIDGLNPNIEKHGINIDFETLSGTPLRAEKRIQFNMKLLQNDKVEIFKDLRAEQLIPLFWVEEGLALNKTFTNMLKYQLFLAIRLVTVIKWTCLIGGLGVLITVTGLKYRSKLLKFTISPSNTDRVQELKQKQMAVDDEADDGHQNNGSVLNGVVLDGNTLKGDPLNGKLINGNNTVKNGVNNRKLSISTIQEAIQNDKF